MSAKTERPEWVRMALRYTVDGLLLAGGTVIALWGIEKHESNGPGQSSPVGIIDPASPSIPPTPVQPAGDPHARGCAFREVTARDAEPCPDALKALGAAAGGVYASASGGRLLVHGAPAAGAKAIHVVELASCRVEQSLPAPGDVQVSGEEMEIGGACACPAGLESACDCDAARVYAFDEACRPLEQSDASRELTWKQLGVRFAGRVRIVHPYTPQASLAQPAGK